jgi:hypothetical protein
MNEGEGRRRKGKVEKRTGEQGEEEEGRRRKEKRKGRKGERLRERENKKGKEEERRGRKRVEGEGGAG